MIRQMGGAWIIDIDTRYGCIWVVDGPADGPR